MKFPLLSAALLFVVFCRNVALAGEWRLTVQAGEYDRRDTLVACTAPAELRGAEFFLRDASSGSRTPLQIDATGRAFFIEPALAKGASKTYSLTPAAVAELPAPIISKREGGALKFSAGDMPIFHYQMEPGPVPAGTPEVFRHGAHLHPLFSPNGRVLTANHPPDHPHQRGIFMAWTKTEFEGRHPDFWNMGKTEGGFTGEVRFASLERVWSGPVAGGFRSQHRFIDHTGAGEKDVLFETWEVTATRLPRAFLIDFVSMQKTAGDASLKLPKYHYGGFGLRGAAAWDPVDQVTMQTSEGLDRKSGDNTKARWVYLGGMLEGQPAGIAVLIHPENFRFPQALRLNPKNPQLCVAPSQDGDWEIAPGQTFVSRYRLIAADAAADPVAIERQWLDYAHPPLAVFSN